MDTPQRFRCGAYGFRLGGVPDSRGALPEVPSHWPLLDIAQTTEVPAGRGPEVVTDARAQVWLAGGGVADVERHPPRALLRVPGGASGEAIAHPYLAPVALVASRWLGREGFHGGGIVVDGGVWAVLGDKTAGKSTLLAWVARTDVGVVSDDVLIIDGQTVFAGPRSIDLRAEAAERLGAGELIGRVGARDRWRVPLPPVEPELPLRGWITLEWGDSTTLEAIRGAERLTALLPHRGVRLVPADPAALVRLSGLPHLRLTRPRDWAAMPEATELLQRTLPEAA